MRFEVPYLCFVLALTIICVCGYRPGKYQRNVMILNGPHIRSFAPRFIPSSHRVFAPIRTSPTAYNRPRSQWIQSTGPRLNRVVNHHTQQTIQMARPLSVMPNNLRAHRQQQRQRYAMRNTPNYNNRVPRVRQSRVVNQRRPIRSRPNRFHTQRSIVNTIGRRPALRRQNPFIRQQGFPNRQFNPLNQRRMNMNRLMSGRRGLFDDMSDDWRENFRDNHFNDNDNREFRELDELVDIDDGFDNRFDSGFGDLDNNFNRDDDKREFGDSDFDRNDFRFSRFGRNQALSQLRGQMNTRTNSVLTQRSIENSGHERSVRHHTTRPINQGNIPKTLLDTHRILNGAKQSFGESVLNSLQNKNDGRFTTPSVKGTLQTPIKNIQEGSMGINSVTIADTIRNFNKISDNFLPGFTNNNVKPEGSSNLQSRINKNIQSIGLNGVSVNKGNGLLEGGPKILNKVKVRPNTGGQSLDQTIVVTDLIGSRDVRLPMRQSVDDASIVRNLGPNNRIDGVEFLSKTNINRDFGHVQIIEDKDPMFTQVRESIPEFNINSNMNGTFSDVHSLPNGLGEGVFALLGLDEPVMEGSDDSKQISVMRHSRVASSADVKGHPRPNKDTHTSKTKQIVPPSMIVMTSSGQQHVNGLTPNLNTNVQVNTVTPTQPSTNNLRRSDISNAVTWPVVSTNTQTQANNMLNTVRAFNTLSALDNLDFGLDSFDEDLQV